MGKLKDAFTDIPDIGACSLDRDKALSLYDKYCFITKYTTPGKTKAEYRICRLKSKSKNFRSLKLTIFEEDALFLIKKLELKEYKDVIFISSSAFYRDDYNPN